MPARSGSLMRIVNATIPMAKVLIPGPRVLRPDLQAASACRGSFTSISCARPYNPEASPGAAASRGSHSRAPGPGVTPFRTPTGV